MAGELASLVHENQVGAVYQSITLTIAGSYKVDRQRAPVGAIVLMTADETKRRFKICIERFKNMRGDLKFSLPRALDELPHALRCALDQKEWKPKPERSLWIPTDGTR
jgi:hypothetical protein